MVAPECISWIACSKSSSCPPSTESVTREARSFQRSMRTLKNFATLSIGNFPSWYHWIIFGINCSLSTMGNQHFSVQAYLFGEAVPFHTPHQKHPCLWSICVSRLSVPRSGRNCKQYTLICVPTCTLNENSGGATPRKISFPRRAVNWSPASSRTGTPVVSITIVAPSPPVSFLTCSTMSRSAEEVSRQSVAPNVFASSNLDLTRSTPMTFVQPIIFAACYESKCSACHHACESTGLLTITAARPTPPNPSTTRLS